jgi:hypothetical protein
VLIVTDPYYRILGFLTREITLIWAVNMKCWVQIGFDYSYTNLRVVWQKNTVINPPPKARMTVLARPAIFTWPFIRRNLSGSWTEIGMEMVVY